MHHKAHVRLRAQARAKTQLNGAGQLVARWVPSLNVRREMRWERRFAPPTLITRIRGEAAARRLDRCN